jgi:hypothetical protein
VRSRNGPRALRQLALLLFERAQREFVLWTETIISEELGYGATEPNELRAAMVTLAAFLTIAFLPSMVFAYAISHRSGAPERGRLGQFARRLAVQEELKLVAEHADEDHHPKGARR